MIQNNFFILSVISVCISNGLVICQILAPRILQKHLVCLVKLPRQTWPESRRGTYVSSHNFFYSVETIPPPQTQVKIIIKKSKIIPNNANRQICRMMPDAVQHFYAYFIAPGDKAPWTIWLSRY